MCITKRENSWISPGQISGDLWKNLDATQLGLGMYNIMSKHDFMKSSSFIARLSCLFLLLRAEEGGDEAYVTPKKPTRLRRCASKTPDALAVADTADTKGKVGKGKTKGKGKGISPAQVLAVLQAKGKIGCKGKGTPDGKGDSKQKKDTPPEGILKRKKSNEPVAVTESPVSKQSPKQANHDMPTSAAENKKKKTAEAEAEPHGMEDSPATPAETPVEKKKKKKKEAEAQQQALEESPAVEKKRKKNKDRTEPAEHVEEPCPEAPHKPKKKKNKKLAEHEEETPETPEACQEEVQTPATECYVEAAEERRALKAQNAEVWGDTASMKQTRLDDLKHVIKTPRRCPTALGQNQKLQHRVQTNIEALWGWAGQQAPASKGKSKGESKGKGKGKNGGAGPVFSASHPSWSCIPVYVHI